MRSRFRRCIAAPALVAAGGLLGGCGPGEPGAADAVFDSAGIRVVERSDELPDAREIELDAAWGPSEGLELGRLEDVAVLPDGRVALLDGLNARVTVLGREGAVEHAFGRPGEGPGELSPHILTRLVATDSTILVPEIQAARISEFAHDGAFIETHSLAELASSDTPPYGIEWRRHPDGGLAFRLLEPTGDLLLRLHRAGVDTLLALDGGAGEGILPPTPLWDVDAGGRIVVARSHEARAELRVPGQPDPVWTIRRDEEAPELDAEAREHLEELLVRSAAGPDIVELDDAEREELVGSVAFPERAPLHTDVLADPDGRFWLQRAPPVRRMGMEALRVGSVRGTGGGVWEVIGGDGRLVDAVRLPDGFSPRRFARGCLYGIREDELGLRRPARACPDD